ncbi:MAG: hypothetical protein WCP79_00100 [Bacillota bacterium]
MAIERIAFYLNRRDEVPNRELAQELAVHADVAGLMEVRAGLSDKNRNVRSDCLKVLYEAGYSRPDLIAGFVDDFIVLLDAKENRMQWGAMIALALISGFHPAKLFALRSKLIAKMQHGTLITQVWGLKLFVGIIAANRECFSELRPVLKQYIESARSLDLPGRLEHYAPILDPVFAGELAGIIGKRTDLKTVHVKRINKVLKNHGLKI